MEPLDKRGRQAQEPHLGAQSGSDDAAGVDVLATAVRIVEDALFKLPIVRACDAKR